MTDYIASDWAENDPSNTGVSPNGAQGGYAPSNIGPIIRAIRGAAKRDFVRTNPIYTTTGTSNAYILTFVQAPTAYYKGMILSFWADRANTGAATLNVNSLGAKAILSQHGVALTSSQIKAGKACVVVYDGTQFVLLGNEVQDPKFTGAVSVTGSLTANTIIGDGAAITNVNAATVGSIAPSTIALNTRNIVAGNGLTGGGNLTADRTITLGAPSTITIDSTNAVSGNTHSHALLLTLSDINTIQGYQSADRLRSIVAGNGLSGGGDLTTDRTVTLGTPGTITNATTNAVTASSHTHAITMTAADVGAVPVARTVTTGNGLTGGGALSANQVITLGTPGTLNNSTTNAATASSHTHSVDFAGGIASMAVGTVGTYALLAREVAGSDIAANNTFAGSVLRYVGFGNHLENTSASSGGTNGTSPGGTWRAMGTVTGHTNNAFFPATVFLRIS